MVSSTAAPPYFHALAAFACKSNRLYRIYVRPDELVFIWAGSSMEGVAGAHAAGTANGLLGALLGILIAKAWTRRRRMPPGGRCWMGRLLRYSWGTTRRTCGLPSMSSRRCGLVPGRSGTPGCTLITGTKPCFTCDIAPLPANIDSESHPWEDVEIATEGFPCSGRAVPGRDRMVGARKEVR